jgi:hypothetical protein
MEYALKNIVLYGRPGPGVGLGELLALESHGLVVGVSWEATEEGRSYYGEWLKGSTL